MRLMVELAQVAELVDALVSNTSGSNTVSVRSRPWVLKTAEKPFFYAFLLVVSPKNIFLSKKMMSYNFDGQINRFGTMSVKLKFNELLIRVYAS